MASLIIFTLVEGCLGTTSLLVQMCLEKRIPLSMMSCYLILIAL